MSDIPYPGWFPTLSRDCWLQKNSNNIYLRRYIPKMLLKIRKTRAHKHIDRATQFWRHIILSLKNAYATTLSESATNVKIFSAWSIFLIRSQSRKRCSTRECLLSRQDSIMLSTWWCRKLLYGYLVAVHKIIRLEIISPFSHHCQKELHLTRRINLKFFVLLQGESIP